MKDWLAILPILAIMTLIAIIIAPQFTKPVEARQSTPCYRPDSGPYMRGSQPCSRIPTVEKPYCPFP